MNDVMGDVGFCGGQNAEQHRRGNNAMAHIASGLLYVITFDNRLTIKFN